MDMSTETLGVMLDILGSDKSLPKDQFGRFDFIEGLKAEHQRILGRTYDPDVYDRAFTFAASGVFNHVPTRSLSARAYIHRKFLTKVAAGVLAVAAVAGTGIGLQSAATARHAAEQERTVVALETNVQHSLNRIFTLPPQDDAARDAYFTLKDRFQKADSRNDMSELRTVGEEAATLERKLALAYTLEADCAGSRLGFVWGNARPFIIVKPFKDGQNINIPIFDKERQAMIDANYFALGVDQKTFNDYKQYKKEGTCALHTRLAEKRSGYLNPSYETGVRADDMTTRWK